MSVLYLFLHAHVCVCMLAHVCKYANHSRMSSIFLNHFCTLFLIQGLSLNLEVTKLAWLFGQ